MIGTLVRPKPHTRALRWIVDVHDDPSAVVPHWRRLEAHGHATAFQSSDWLLPWYRAASAAGRAEPLILSVRRERAHEPCLILPLCRRKTAGLTTVEAADLDLSDYVAPVMATSEHLDDGDAVLAAKAALAKLPQCDIVHLNKIAPMVGGRGNPLTSLHGAGPSALSAYGVALKAPFAEHARTVLDASVHRDLQRVGRKLAAERGAVELVIARDGAEAAVLFDQLLAIRGARFGDGDVLTDPSWQAFYRHVFTGGDRASFARVIALRTGSEIVAVDLAIEHHNALVILAGAFRFDDEWRKYGLGKLLTFHEMQWAADRGLGIFDLSIGAEAYKFKFGVTEMPLREWMCARSLRGQIAVATWRAKAALRERPDLMRRIKGVLGR